MYGEQAVNLKENIAKQIVDKVNTVILLEQQGYQPRPQVYSELAIGCILQDCVNIVNDINIDFIRTTKLLYNNYVTT